MQQILQLNMGLSVVESLKTYDVEKVVSTFLGCFQSNSFRCREAGTHGQDVQIFTIPTGIKSVDPVSRQNRRHPSFSVGSVHWLMCRVLQFGESPCIFRSLKISS